ncbi:MAG: C1 family peptidase [Oligoflexia bacterium]|nr:C1 family peptidase [Oligoflexia bacterium]
MNNKKTLIFLILSFVISWNTHSSVESIIVDQIKKSIYKEYDLSEKPKTVIRSRQEFKNKKEAAEISQGNKRINDVLARNRELLKKRAQMQKRGKKEMLSNKQDQWMESKKSDRDLWQNEKIRMLNRWAKDRQRFLKQIPEYKKTTVKLEVPKKVFKKNTDKIIKANLSSMNRDIDYINEVKVVKNSMNVKIKDQGKRPTCSSFAGVRAMEIKLKQMGIEADLSEQFFYYLSKPDCQQSKCNKRGSWVYQAFDQKKYGISSESQCPYQRKSLTGNETQIPLKKSCFQGSHFANGFNQISSFEALKSQLDLDHPVVGAFKLSESFYDNKGFVFSTRSGGLGKDSHAKGHAILIVGYMKLPKKISNLEGPYCFLVANSWGEGWGKGGHSCLSQKWVERYMYDTPMISLTNIRKQ